MAFFSKISEKLKKKHSGTTSNISKLRSPYRSKPFILRRTIKKERKKTSLLIPPARLKAPTSGKHHFWGIAVVLVLLIFGSYWVFFSHFFDIKSWETIEDGDRLDKQDPINQILSRERNHNLFLVGENGIIKAIASSAPDIEKINVIKIFPNKLRVEIKKYDVVANIINTSGNMKKSLLMNSIGEIVDQNNENPTLPYIKITTAQPFTMNKVAFTKDKLDYILGAYREFEQKFGMKLIDCEYFSRERELHLRTERNFKVWLDMQKPFDDQFDKMKKAMVKSDILDIYHLPLKYIDLRISGIDNEKVIFCRSDNSSCASRNS